MLNLRTAASAGQKEIEMKNITSICFICILTACAGCFGMKTKQTNRWLVDFAPQTNAPKPPETAPAVKLIQTNVVAPYNGAQIAVLRADGTVAFDAYNTFAAQPAAILSPAAFDALYASGRFSNVIRPNSSASSQLEIEITVTRLALDCRNAGERKASVELFAVLTGKRQILSSAKTSASVDAGSGDYSKAFSEAFSQALLKAAAQLDLNCK